MIFHDFWFDNYFNYVYFYLFFNDLFYFFSTPRATATENKVLHLVGTHQIIISSFNSRLH